MDIAIKKNTERLAEIKDTFKIFSDQASWVKKVDFFAHVKEISSKFKKELIITIILVLTALLFFF